MDHNRTIYTQSAQETQEEGRTFAVTLVDSVSRGDAQLPYVLCLYGDLGSGKTTFIQGFGRGLGIDTRLLSPTFIIVRRYKIPKSIYWFYHLDLYRVIHEKDLASLGIREILQNPHAIVAIEWAEKLGSFMPEHRIDVEFSILQSGGHQINSKEIQ